MRVRPAFAFPLLLAFGCQDKKPAGPAAPSEMSPAAVEATATATAPTAPGGLEPTPPPVEGTLDGKPFRPDTVSMDGTKEGPVLVFHHTEGKGESSIGIVTVPVPEGEKL